MDDKPTDDQVRKAYHSQLDVLLDLVSADGKDISDANLAVVTVAKYGRYETLVTLITEFRDGKFFERSRTTETWIDEVSQGSTRKVIS